MKWFSNPETLEDLKKQYHRLAMKHHPDVGGTEQAMKEINAEYEKLRSSWTRCGRSWRRERSALTRRASPGIVLAGC